MTNKLAKSKSVTVTHPKKLQRMLDATLRQMPDAELFKVTITKVEDTSWQMVECAACFREIQRRFDNRGKGQRTICGYKGWIDFVERGLGKNIRTFQRQLLEVSEPERAEQRRLKARNDRKQLVHVIEPQSDLPVETPLANPSEQATSEPEIIDGIVEPEAVPTEIVEATPKTIGETCLDVPWGHWESMLDVMQDNGPAPDAFIPIFDQLKAMIESVDSRKPELRQRRRAELADSIRFLIDEWFETNYAA